MVQSRPCEVSFSGSLKFLLADHIIGAVETLQLETSSFGIRTLLVEPGFFRTDLLNANNTVYVDTRFEDYKPVTEALFSQFKGAHQQQPGDPVKGVQRIIDVVKGENGAAGKEFPLSVALGSDAVAHIRQKCNDTLKLLEEWEDVSSNTDLD